MGYIEIKNILIMKSLISPEHSIKPSLINETLESYNTTPLKHGLQIN